MSVIIIQGFGDADLLHRFVTDWNNADKTPQKHKDIYIDSPGGYVSIFKTIQHMINACPGKCCLTASGEIHSAAFDLFYSTVCERKVLPHTFGMFHLGYAQIEIDENGKAKEDYGKALLDNLKLMKSGTLKFCKKLGMNEKELKEITTGKDVYFQADRLNYFLSKK